MASVVQSPRAHMHLLAILSRNTTMLDRSRFAPASAVVASAKLDGWCGAIFHRATREWCTVRVSRSSGEGSGSSIESELRGDVLVAHHDYRRTPPALSRDGWMFCHDGALRGLDVLRRGISAKRQRELGAPTRSELLFAYLLTRLDSARVTTDPATDAALREATAELIADRVGGLNFILSNGAVLYAHRFGPPLYIMQQREPAPAIVIASEPLTDEPWVALDDGALLRCRTGEHADVVALRGVDPWPADITSEPELPFTD
jgi:predicted glutamine amidotransferase